MYTKKIKKRFRDFVIMQADLTVQGISEQECFWHCVYYASGLREALIVVNDDYRTIPLFSISKFRKIFSVICDYRKGVH